MKIMGIDPGFGRMGFGVIEFNGHDFHLIDTGCLTTEAGSIHADRLKTLADNLRQLFNQHQPDRIALEELFFGKSTTTAMRVAEARGIALLVCSEFHLPVFELKPNQIKLSVTGNGRADKKQIQTMICRWLNLSRAPHPDDAADALAAAICAATIRHD